MNMDLEQDIAALSGTEARDLLALLVAAMLKGDLDEQRQILSDWGLLEITL